MLRSEHIDPYLLCTSMYFDSNCYLWGYINAPWKFAQNALVHLYCTVSPLVNFPPECGAPNIINVPINTREFCIVIVTTSTVITTYLRINISL